jgi:hypothetical protein
MWRRPILASVMLVIGLVMVLAYAEPAGFESPTGGPGSALAVVPTDTPTNTPTATATRTATPTPTPTVGPAASIVLSLSANPISCGTSTTVFATVRDINGNPVANGTAVHFSTSLGGLGTALTSGGVAAINLGAPVNFAGSIVVSASSGNVVSSQIVVTVVCAVVPFQLIVSGGGTTVCGTSNQLAVTVVDGLGRPIVDGTAVTFQTTIGTITPSSATVGGFATAVLTVPANTSGTAIVAVSAGGLVRQVSVVITCSATATPRPPATATPQAQVAAAPRLPSAGSGPATDPSPLLLYAGAALILVSLGLFAKSVVPGRRRNQP